MERNSFLLLLVLVGLNQLFEVGAELTVTIENGPIKGFKDGDYWSFLGIPYAKPPVGDLRFEPPQRYSIRWNKTQTFDMFGPKCAQFNHFGYIYDGDEDCLHLNVFVPVSIMEQHICDSPNKHGVIFFIHGGQFMFGGSRMYGVQNIMEYAKIIVVTIQFRLGVLGFLSAEDKDFPGNLGLKDQVAALQWVQRNIEAFHGDPKRVTISGFSAGAASVHLHIISKLSDGLFKNAISHSGTALNPWVMQDGAKQKFKDLLVASNCTRSYTKESVECLKDVNVRELVMFSKRYQKLFYMPVSVFGAVVEPEQDGAFITEKPLTSVQDGNFKKVTWLITTTIEEGIYPAAELHDKQYMMSIAHRWKELCPFLIDINATEHDCKFKQQVCKKVKDRYFNDTRISLESFTKLKNMFTDRFQHWGAYRAAELHSTYAEAYMYLFLFPTQNVLPIGEWTGVEHDDTWQTTHGDDVFLIFWNINARGPDLDEYTTDEYHVSHALIEMYFDFNKYGQAVYEGGMLPLMMTDDENTKGQVKLLEIHGPHEIEYWEPDEDEFGKCKFWESLKIIE